jgi:tetratricopeptide (TPR) repeat protein
MSYTPLQLADAFIKAGELDDALDALNQHLADHPNDAEGRRLRAQVLLRTATPDHLRLALADLQAVPPTAADDFILSVIHERSGQPDEALALARQAYETATDDALKARSLERLLGLMQAAGQVQAALDMALANDWMQWAADAAAALNADAAAADYYTQALERIGKLYDITSDAIAANIRARVLLKRAGVYHRLKRFTEADADYASAQAIIPDDPMIGFNRGLIAADQNDNDAARTAIHTALQTAPSSLQTLMLAELRANPTYEPFIPADA